MFGGEAAHMTITYKLEPHDLRAFQRYAQKHLPSARRVRYILWAVIVGYALLLTLSSDDHRLGFRVFYFCVTLILFWLIMRICMFVFTRAMQWRSYTSDKHKSVLCEHTVTLAEDALIESTPFNEGRNLWSGVYRVIDTADYIYIFITLHAAHIIPKRAFSDIESARRFYERASSLQSGAQRIAQPEAASNCRSHRQMPASPDVQPSASQGTLSSGNCSTAER